MNQLDPKDQRPSQQATPGYFRLGFITLDIPPEDIVTTRVTNADEITPLRAQYAMYIKTGQARWDVTVRWTALATATDSGLDYRQWEDLRYIIAMFKASPFVEVENAHLRQVFFAIDPSMDHQRMAFGLRQLRIETPQDMVNALVCTLTMTYFNYYPYTKDFGYLGDKGQPVSAYQSTAFKDYLDTWIGHNLNEPARDPTGDDFPSGDDWQDQVPGTLALSWRRYLPVSTENSGGSGDMAKFTALQDPAPPAPAASRIASPAAVSGSGSGLPFAGQVSQAFSDKVVAISSDLGIDPAWLMNVMHFETGGTFSPAVRNRSGSSAVGLIQFVAKTAATLGTNVTALAQMSAENQLDYVYAYLKPYSGRMMNQGDVAMAVFAPVSIGQADTFVLYRQPSLSYQNNQGLDQEDKGFITRGDYVRHLVSQSGPAARLVPAAVQVTGAAAPADPAPANRAISQQQLDTMNANLALQVKRYNDELEKNGWVLDYSTELDAFFYKQHDIRLTDESHGDAANEFSLYPEGFVVLFVNNLAQLPLSSYQYPTYQHVGPAATTIYMSMKSNGIYNLEADVTTQDPDHPGIQALSEMSHILEDQFYRMKARWRSVASVHRMQAVRVYNQILNLLGIHSVLLKDVTTATIQESPNAVALQLTASHYENFFEEVGEYLVKGIKNTYMPQFLKYLESDIDTGMTPQEKKNIFQLLKYRDARNARDIKFLSAFIADKTQESIDAVDVPGAFSPEDKAAIASFMQTFIFPGGLRPQVGPKDRGGFGSVAENYPAYAARIQQNGASLTDYLLVYGVLQKELGQLQLDPSVPVDPALIRQIKGILPRLQALGDPYNQAVDRLYDIVLLSAAAHDPLFSQQMQLVINDPKFRDRIKDVGHAQGPAADNAGHGAYRDMGLLEMTRGGVDFNPGSYFFDHAQEFSSAMKDGIRQAVVSSDQVNKASSNAAAVTNSTPLEQSELFLKGVQLPQQNMAAAFPTYKLFLLEEDNNGLFYAFDDFYSYSSVIDIEIIKFRDRPHLAEIRMTNLAHLLSHKLFDDTVMGKREASLNRNVRVPVDKSMTIAGPAGGIIESAGEDSLGRNYIQVPGRRLTEGYGNNYNEIPLAYFPLQPGTKIEIRMGFSNNPDNLTRVFAGVVAEIEGDEILTVRAQGFQAELMEVAADKIGFDTWTLANLGGKGPRFGGGRIWGDSGDTGSVMKKVLEVSSAKHFGHWQLLKPDHPLMRGWPWQRSVGIALETLGSTSLGPMLQVGSDRSGQNILINHVINSDGTIVQGRANRTFFSQTPWWSFSAWYGLDEDKDKDRTAWDIIRDVARRYPEYILAVKDYGFPYGCDATLVFGHPRDAYYARPFNYDEARNEAQLDANASDDFRQWWHAQGRALTETALEAANSVSPYLLRGLFLTGVPNTLDLAPHPVTLGPVTILVDIDNRGVVAFDELIAGVAESSAAALGAFIQAIVPNFIADSGKFEQTRREILGVQRQWQIYRNAVKPPLFSLLAPVRKFHYVDFQTIIGNGIVVNDKVNNAVRIQGTVVKANDTMPAQYIRVLDADEIIIEPKDNVESQGLTNAYAESFLREEVGKMYRGELVLRGTTQIEPWDVIFLTDPSSGMSGPVEVDKVVHSFSQEQGYITIVTPRTYISVNEASGQDFAHRLINGITSAHRLVGAGVNEFMQADTTAQTAALIVPAAVSATAAGAISAVSGTAGSLAAPVVSLIGASATPPGWLAWAVVGSLAVGGAAYVIARNQAINPILISPLMRFGKPWIGGMEGYQISDFARLVHERWTQFWIDEVEPTLLSYKLAKGYLENTL